MASHFLHLVLMSSCLAIDGSSLVQTTFTVTEDRFGDIQEIPLREGGEKEYVTDANKEVYIHLVTQRKLVDSIKSQLLALQQGLCEVIPLSLLRVFTVDEFYLLLNGQPRIDVDDWKEHTNYGGVYTPDHPVILWFWDIIRNRFSHEERSRLLQFTTGDNDTLH
ncbi:hect-domain (ubiquitin-transferase) domain-containing protein [Cystoisospora suis]|uniref:HECT-type E3 ubiquitin transferase n=1 Tax=Cystoisospora suis TaxID=483139 RepID=A0A2C6KPQ2_9APIC|nr:hect-domain (ubiquitin-transferase) domain-containing protein [Cystoisospora suis]